MSRKARLLAAIMLFALPLAHADEATKRVKIDQLFLAMHMDESMKQMLKVGMSGGEQMAQSIFGTQPLSDSDQKLLDEFEAKTYTLMNETLGWSKLEPVYIDLYAAAYTEEDIDVMLAFYKTPTGQKMVATMAAQTTKSMQIVTSKMQEVQPKMQALVKEFADKVKAAHAEQSPGPPL
jgi:hypothetical protein